MATFQDLLAAMKHIESRTGDRNGWMQGLSARDIAVAQMSTTGPADLDAVLAKIHRNHPTLFDPHSGAPLVPGPAPRGESPGPEPDQPREQRGAAATALKKAEDDLAQQNSATSRLDLLVISAVLNAHTKSAAGTEALGKLQRDINDAVRDRTDLDTPAGARDFQRYLIGKLREIGAVVDSAILEDTSKAALAGAWSALYEASKAAEKPDATAAPAAPATAPKLPPTAPEQAAPLPPYGMDTAGPMTDPWLPMEEGLPPESAPTAAQPAALQPAPAAPAMMPAVPTMPMTSALPGIPGLGGGPPPVGPSLAGISDEPALRSSTHPLPGEPSLEELLSEGDAEDRESQHGEESAEDTQSAPTDKPSAESTVSSTTVRLPDGDTITAPTPQIADAIRASLAGTPIGAAFQQQGLIIPPAGTAVAHPVDPSKLVAGDIGMFTDRQAVALDQQRALLNGQIEPLTRVSGPSFLGWLHPSTQGTDGSPAMTPNGAAAPPPTRPATTVGYRS